MSAFSYPLHDAYYRRRPGPHSDLEALANDYERRAAQARALANRRGPVYAEAGFHEPELSTYGVPRRSSYVELDSRPQRYGVGRAVRHHAYYPEEPVVLSRYAPRPSSYADPFEGELVYEEPVEYRPRRRLLSARRAPVELYPDEEELIALPRYHRASMPAPVRRVPATAPAAAVTTVPHVHRHRIQTPPAITYEYEVPEPVAVAPPEYVHESRSPHRVVLGDPTEALIRAAAHAKQQQEREQQWQQQLAVSQARQNQQRLAQQQQEQQRRQPQGQLQAASEDGNGLEQLLSLLGGLLPQVQNIGQSQRHPQARQEQQTSAPARARTPAQSSEEIDIENFGPLLASIGLNIAPSASEKHIPPKQQDPARAPTPAPARSPTPARNGDGFNLDTLNAFLTSLGLNVAELSGASTPEEAPTQAPPNGESQQQRPQPKPSVRFSINEDEVAPVAISTSTEGHDDTSAPVRYTYAAPASAQRDAVRRPAQKAPAATAAPATPTPVTAESRRRADAAAEAQQIMHAIRLSLDPGNDVKPSDVPASLSTRAPVVANSADRGRSEAREQAKTTKPSPVRASALTPTRAPVRIPVRSPSPPASKPRSPMETIEAVEEKFVNLGYGFVFPEHVDFAEPSSSPTPSLLYTPANAPIRQHEFDLTSLLTQLDAVDSEGQESVRAARKELVLRIESALERLERAKAEAWAKQNPVAAAAAKSAEPELVGDEVPGESATDAPFEETVEEIVEDAVVVDEPAATAAEGAAIGDAELGLAVGIESPSASEPIPTREPVEPSTSVEAEVSAAEPTPLSYPPALALSWTPSTLAEPSPKSIVDMDENGAISSESSPFQVPSDFEPSEYEADEPSDKTEDVPPSMEESAQLERNTEFVMI